MWKWVDRQLIEVIKRKRISFIDDDIIKGERLLKKAIKRSERASAIHRIETWMTFNKLKIHIIIRGYP